MPDEWPELRRADLRLSFRHPAVTPDGQLVEIVEEFPRDAHRVHLIAPNPGEIYLELFRMPGLSAQLKERLDTKVDVVDPFRRLSVDSRVDRSLIEECGPALAVTVGLATRRPGDK